MQALTLAVLPLIGVAVGAALQFLSGRSLEARKQLSLEKARAYADFFRAVALIAQNSTKEHLALAADAKTRICIYGSKAVLAKLIDFGKVGSNSGTDAGRSALSELMQAMREDVVGGRVILTLEDFSRILFGEDATRSNRMAELARLAALPDDQIDTTDIPEVPPENWAYARRGRP